MLELVQTCIALAFMSDEPRTWNILLPSWSYVSSSEPARYPAPLPPCENWSLLNKPIMLNNTWSTKGGLENVLLMYHNCNVLKLLYAVLFACSLLLFVTEAIGRLFEVMSVMQSNYLWLCVVFYIICTDHNTGTLTAVATSYLFAFSMLIIDLGLGKTWRYVNNYPPLEW